VEITGSSDPLPTIILGGQFIEGGEEEDKLPDERRHVGIGPGVHVPFTGRRGSERHGTEGISKRLLILVRSEWGRCPTTKVGGRRARHAIARGRTWKTEGG
jgi:hypothetical protein